jgi:hypothetical protein
MLTDREIVAAMQEANPLPEPELLSMDPAGFDVLLEKISERRVPMLHTPDMRTEQSPGDAHPIAPGPKRVRKPAVVLVSFVLMLAAVGIGALIFLGGGADTAPEATTTTAEQVSPTTAVTTIPSATTVPEVAPTTPVPVAPIPAGEFITYGPEQGVPNGCGYSIAFAGTDAYLAGECGLLHFNGTTWRHLAELPYSNWLLDVAVAPDGTLWVADVDFDVLRWNGRELVEYDFRAYAIEVTSDGTVWAIQYPRWDNWEAEQDQLMALWHLEDSEWVLDKNEDHEGLTTGPDGTLWVETRGCCVVVDGFDHSYPVLRSFDGSSWMTHDTPANSRLAGFASDGSIIVTQDHTVAVQDGDDWVSYDLPTLAELGIDPIYDELGVPTIGDPDETLDLRFLRITEQETLWGLSYYGAFSFDGDEWTRYTTAEGLASDKLLFVEIGPDGSLWFGTEDAGVTRYLPEQ